MNGASIYSAFHDSKRLSVTGVAAILPDYLRRAVERGDRPRHGVRGRLKRRAAGWRQVAQNLQCVDISSGSNTPLSSETTMSGPKTPHTKS